MRLQQHQFSVRYLVIGISAVAVYLGVARMVEPKIVGVGVVLLLFWFPLVLILATRPPEIAPRPTNRPIQRESLRWRIAFAALIAMTISLFALIWVARGR